MATIDDIAPKLSPDILVRPGETPGTLVLKNPRGNKYLRLGEQESFLLNQLDGTTSFDQIRESFEGRYQESLSRDDIDDFVSMVRKERLLEGDESAANDVAAGPQGGWLRGLIGRCVKQSREQSVFFFRVALFNPNAILEWLEPRTRWLFNKRLANGAAFAFCLAVVVTWANRAHLVTQVTEQLGWRLLVLAWLTTMIVTICHEFGHGLACKRYGGDVHEMGALWIFFTPCLFCNVSDMWLVPSRRQRFIVSMAGTYVDLLIWIASVFVWRVTAQHTALNYMALIVVTTCGVRVIFNINPLLRLDGYYALSDLWGIPNLRRLGRQRLMEHFRWLLWGAAKPAPMANGRKVLFYGIASWCFTITLLNLIFFKVTSILQSLFGLAGFLAGATVFISLSKKYFKGSLGGEFMTMFQIRPKRAMLWAAATCLLLFTPIHDRAGGTFHVRPAIRWEVRSPVDGFLREVTVDEGDYIEAGEILARFEIPELSSLLRQKAAEIAEVKALLRRLEVGPRSEEVTEQEERVHRATNWRDLALTDLSRARLSLTEELSSLLLQITQAESEFEYQKILCNQAQQLYEKGGLAGQQLLAERKRLRVAESQLKRIQADKRGRAAHGAMTFEAELARREKELADARATLTLLLAGSRKEDVEAEQARLVRLDEEHKHLLVRKEKQIIYAPSSGTVTTPRLKEKIGQFLAKGAEICFLEDLDYLEAEVAVSEQDARFLVSGQSVSLKPRSLPFTRLHAVVDRVAPSALSDPLTSQKTVTVYCQVKNGDTNLRTGMTGFGRVYHRWRPIGWIGLSRAMQFIRTEFWL
jgi:putative peptide zinc metalloprotease protein